MQVCDTLVFISASNIHVSFFFCLPPTLPLDVVVVVVGDGASIHVQQRSVITINVPPLNPAIVYLTVAVAQHIGKRTLYISQWLQFFSCFRFVVVWLSRSPLYIDGQNVILCLLHCSHGTLATYYTHNFFFIQLNSLNITNNMCNIVYALCNLFAGKSIIIIIIRMNMIIRKAWCATTKYIQCWLSARYVYIVYKYIIL